MTGLLDERNGAPDRFSAPLYTVAEAARHLGVPESTFGAWVRGSRRRGADRGAPSGPLVTARAAFDPGRRGATIPFIGLAEGLVLAALRRSGVPLQRVRPALARLEEDFGVRHALASRRLYTDGSEVLYDYARPGDEAGGAAPDVVVARSDQRVLGEVLDSYLSHLEFAEDGYPRLIRLPRYQVAEVVVDPARGFGQPTFATGGARVEDALAMLRAGEDLEAVAAEYRVPAGHLRDAVRVATLAAA